MILSFYVVFNLIPMTYFYCAYTPHNNLLNMYFNDMNYFWYYNFAVSKSIWKVRRYIDCIFTG